MVGFYRVDLELAYDILFYIIGLVLVENRLFCTWYNGRLDFVITRKSHEDNIAICVNAISLFLCLRFKLKGSFKIIHPHFVVFAKSYHTLNCGIIDIFLTMHDFHLTCVHIVVFSLGEGPNLIWWGCHHHIYWQFCCNLTSESDHGYLILDYSGYRLLI